MVCSAPRSADLGASRMRAQIPPQPLLWGARRGSSSTFCDPIPVWLENPTLACLTLQKAVLALPQPSIARARGSYNSLKSGTIIVNKSMYCKYCGAQLKPENNFALLVVSPEVQFLTAGIETRCPTLQHASKIIASFKKNWNVWRIGGIIVGAIIVIGIIALMLHRGSGGGLRNGRRLPPITLKR